MSTRSMLVAGLVALCAGAAAQAQTAPKSSGPRTLDTSVSLAVTTSGGAVVTVVVEPDGELFSATWLAPPRAGRTQISMIARASSLFDGLRAEAAQMQSRGPTVAVSRFSTPDGLQGRLRQSLRASAGGPGTALLEQVYELRNPTAIPIRTLFLRYQDSDLAEFGLSGEFGLIAPGSAWTYLLSTAAPARAEPTRYVGLSIEGGDRATRAQVNACCGESRITREGNRTVYADADGNGLGDTVQDLSMQNQVVITVAPGQARRFVVRSLFGVERLDSLAPLPR